MKRNANAQRNIPSTPTHAVDSKKGYSRNVEAWHLLNKGEEFESFVSDALGSPPHGYASSAATVGPIDDPRP